MDQSPSTAHAQFSAEKMNSASVDSVLLALLAAMVAPTILKIVSPALMDMSRLVQSAKKAAFLINSTITMKRDVLHALPHALLAHHSITALHARIWPSVPEVVSAQIAPILVLLVTVLEHALLASVDSTTSKEHARHLAHLELDPLMESVNAPQELFLLDNVSPAVDQDSPQFLEAASLATPTVPSVQETSTVALLASVDSPLTLELEDVSQRLAAPTVRIFIKEFVPAFVNQAITSTKAFASMVDASRVILPTPLADASDRLQLRVAPHQVEIAMPINICKTVFVLVPAL